ncbi:MAG: undecaprenyldiphospho-muramoylpentapeptide beta-N-acetylglucosaminyltransferase [Acidobacteriota bacterium]|nr:undecaprenyldiphospho-muramoylpentapeptide beta-N-acetylglucosaminyltransferase [Acidobacteriota bacterium]
MSTGTHRGTVVFSGGGTGGHVFPGLAVAEELRALGWKAAWIGRRGSLEERLVASAGVDFRALPARPFVDRGGPQRAMALAVLLLSTLRAAALLRRLRAALVFATGGYVCAPAALATRLHGSGLYLLEPNAESGSANRRLSRFATEAGVAFESAAGDLACEARLVGVPVRRAFREIDELRLSGDRVRVLVLGGSQGSDALNRHLPALFARAAGSSRVEVTHQSGPASIDETRDRYRRVATTGLSSTVTGFIQDTAGAMQAHDLIVSRAGAVTVAEIAAAGRPAVYVPLPMAAAHQRGNARAMVEAGAAILVEQEQLQGEAAAERCARLIADRERLLGMARTARGLSRSDAASDIAARVCEIAERGISGRRGRAG